MDSKNPVIAFDRMIERYEHRIEIVRRIRDIVGDDPSLVHDLREALADDNGVQVPVISSLGGGTGSPAFTMSSDAATTQSEEVASYFRANGNKWVTAPKIMEATGLARGAVSHVLYKALRGEVEKKDHPNDKKLKLWRLKGGDMHGLEGMRAD